MPTPTAPPPTPPGAPDGAAPAAKATPTGAPKGKSAAPSVMRSRPWIEFAFLLPALLLLSERVL